jgi:hypothetical protein
MNTFKDNAVALGATACPEDELAGFMQQQDSLVAGRFNGLAAMGPGAFGARQLANMLKRLTEYKDCQRWACEMPLQGLARSMQAGSRPPSTFRASGFRHFHQTFTRSPGGTYMPSPSVTL